MSVNPTTGLVTYTPSPADIGNQPVSFAATNSAGTSTYTFYFNVLALNPTVTVTGGRHLRRQPPCGQRQRGWRRRRDAGRRQLRLHLQRHLHAADGRRHLCRQATFTSTDPSYANAVADGTLTINPAAPTITVNGGPFNLRRQHPRGDRDGRRRRRRHPRRWQFPVHLQRRPHAADRSRPLHRGRRIYQQRSQLRLADRDQQPDHQQPRHADADPVARGRLGHL